MVARINLLSLVDFYFAQALCDLRRVTNSDFEVLERGTLTSQFGEPVSRVFTMALTLTESSRIELTCKQVEGSMAVDDLSPNSVNIIAARVGQLSQQ